MVAALEFGTGGRAAACSTLQDAAAQASWARQTRAYDKLAAARRGAASAKVQALAWERHQGGLRHRTRSTTATPRSPRSRRSASRQLKERAGRRRFTPAVGEGAPRRSTRTSSTTTCASITVSGGRIGGRGARRGPHDHLRGGRAPPHARLGALHPRRDAGAGGRPRSAPPTTSSASSCSPGMAFKKFMLHYNFPPFSRERDQAAARPGPPRDRPRRAGRARAAQHAARRARSSRTRSGIVSDILESNGSLVDGLGLRRHACR